MERTARSDRWLFGAFLALLFWAPLPLGSNRLWAWSLLTAIACLLGAWWLLLFSRHRVVPGPAFMRAWPVTAIIGATLGFMLLQTLPLPPGLIALLSPETSAIHAATGAPSRLTLELYSTQQRILLTLAYGIVFCLTLLLVNSHRRMRWLCGVLLASGIFQAAFGSLMVLSGTEYLFFIEKTVNEGVVTGTFVSRNHVSGYLELCLAAGIGLMLTDMGARPPANLRERLRQLIDVFLGLKAPVRIGLVVIVTGLVLSRSRMGNAAFFSSLIIAGLIYLLATRQMTRNKIIFFASLILVDLLVIGNFFGIEEVAERIQQTSLETESRDEMAINTFAMIRDFPLTGTGAGSFYAISMRYDDNIVNRLIVDHAHNDYLEFATELGVPMTALLGFAVLLSLWTAIAAQRERHDRVLRGLGFAATMGIIALMIHSFVDFNLQIPANALTFMVILALGWIARYWQRPPSGHHRGSRRRRHHDAPVP